MRSLLGLVLLATVPACGPAPPSSPEQLALASFRLTPVVELGSARPARLEARAGDATPLLVPAEAPSPVTGRADGAGGVRPTREVAHAPQATAAPVVARGSGGGSGGGAGGSGGSGGGSGGGGASVVQPVPLPAPTAAAVPAPAPTATPALPAGPGAIAGQVCDPVRGGLPVVDAVVRLATLDEPPIVVELGSGSDGRFRIEGLALRDYAITARKPGYDAAAAPIVVRLYLGAPEQTGVSLALYAR